MQVQKKQKDRSKKKKEKSSSTDSAHHQRRKYVKTCTSQNMQKSTQYPKVHAHLMLTQLNVRAGIKVFKKATIPKHKDDMRLKKKETS